MSKSRDPVTAADVNKLSAALSVGNSPEYAGKILAVEPLPNCCFAGEITRIREKVTGRIHKIVSSCYDKALGGEEVTIESKGKLRFLKPKEYTVVGRLRWNAETDKLTDGNVKRKHRVQKV